MYMVVGGCGCGWVRLWLSVSVFVGGCLVGLVTTTTHLQNLLPRHPETDSMCLVNKSANISWQDLSPARFDPSLQTLNLPMMRPGRY